MSTKKQKPTNQQKSHKGKKACKLAGTKLKLNAVRPFKLLCDRRLLEGNCSYCLSVEIYYTTVSAPVNEKNALQHSYEHRQVSLLLLAVLLRWPNQELLNLI